MDWSGGPSNSALVSATDRVWRAVVHSRCYHATFIPLNHASSYRLSMLFIDLNVFTASGSHSMQLLFG